MRVLTFAVLFSFPIVVSGQVSQTAVNSFTPLSAEEKVGVRLKKMVSPMALLGVAVSSGINQWRDNPPEWGQGMEGYGKRAASSEASVISRNTIGLTSDLIFHLEPRYRRMPEARAKSRIWNAVSQTFLAYKDSGGRMINVSQLGGSYGAAFIANTWMPQDRNSVGDAMMRGTWSLAFHTGSNVASEFLPDLFRHFRHSRNDKDASLTKP